MGPWPADAQYFGRNKVQYRDFDFQVVSTEHFDIYYYPEQQELVGHVARMAERWHSRLAKVFNGGLSGRQPLILYASSADFRQTNALSGEIGEGTGGVTEGLRRRIIMPSAGSLAEIDHVLGHELVHAFQYDTSGRGGAGPAFLRMPLWMVEGLAEYLSIGGVDAQTAMWLRDAVASNELPTIRDLDNPRFFPYRFGHAFWAYVAGRWGDDMVMALFDAAMKTSPEDAIRGVLGIEPKQFAEEWHEAIRKAYAGFLEATNPASAFGRVVIDRTRGGGTLNIAPALSPDGTRVVFLSERDLFAVDLFVADVQTGKVLRKLSSTATSPHFDSLQFIESAGSWAPDGRQFAQNAVVRGRGALVLFDTETGKRVREIVFDEFSEIRNPVLAPDGRRVAFAALQGGLLNLWVYDLQSGAKTQLTSDAFADLQPAFSPDGGRLAFVTDRFSTRLDTLAFGNYRIAIYDFADGSVREVPGYEGALHSNPQWQPDGRGLYFVSNVNGAPNVHRVDLASGDLFQVTNVKTGVAGITPLSPSISVAQRSGRLAFAARQDGEYAIYVVEDPKVLAGASPRDRVFATSAAVLPPRVAATGEVDRLRSDPVAGLPTPDLPAPQPYRSRLGLEFVGQPTVGVGVNQFGTYVGGGTSLYFSDMLGNQTLGATVQINGRLQDIAGLVQYTNLTDRFDWGVGISQFPYITAGAFTRYGEVVNGTPVIVDEYLLERQTNTGVYGVGALPFNRAQRLEVQAGYRRVGFGLERRREFYLPDGTFLGEDVEDLDDPADALNLFAPSAALVHDTSIFGLTSPLTGSRARFEVSPNVGTISYTAVLADARAYFMPVRPLTFAFRGMHVGRYGAGGEDERFRSIFIGYPNLVRGYYDVEAEDCALQLREEDCASYSSLFGSRVIVANAEVRAPLFGLFRGRLDYGPLPIEIAFFADAGIAWTSRDKATFLDGTRDWVRSVGVSLRFNVFGFMVVETAYTRPFDRLSNQWVWSWGFTPGF
jgi:Tol biopolymer transport system component